FLLLILRISRYTVFPYTTLFRSGVRVMGMFLKAASIGGSIVVIIALVIALLKALIAFVGFISIAVKIVIVLVINPTKAIRAFRRDRKSTRLNSSHVATSYAVFCL